MSKILAFLAGITLGSLVGLTVGKQYANVAVIHANKECVQLQKEWRDVAYKLRDHWLTCVANGGESDN